MLQPWPVFLVVWGWPPLHKLYWFIFLFFIYILCPFYSVPSFWFTNIHDIVKQISLHCTCSKHLSWLSFLILSLLWKKLVFINVLINLFSRSLYILYQTQKSPAHLLLILISLMCLLVDWDLSWGLGLTMRLVTEF